VKRPLIIFYVAALALHAAVLFWLKPPAPKPPKIFNETYVDVTLTTPPPLQPETKPIVVPPPMVQPVAAPKPEEKPQPPPPPKPEMTIPEPKPEPAPLPPPTETKPIAVPPPQPKPEVSVTQRTLVIQMSNDYPLEAKRRHEHGTVTLMVFISEQGVADKVEVLKSSGYPILDSDAIRKIKIKNWGVIFQDGVPIRSSGTVTVPYILQ
jgi:periplasmic protein TonB